MLNTIVLVIMDRNNWNGRTDNIIIISKKNKKIKWIPRDLYSKSIKNRINTAYSFGGPDLLIRCLKEINIIVDNCICILPYLIDENIDNLVSITVPVSYNMKFYYPIYRHKPIEEGRKIIEFNSPNVTLKGDRIHEWIGARYEITKNTNNSEFPDIHRIKRQQILLKELLKIKYKFIILNNYVRGLNDDVLNLLYEIDSTWEIEDISSKNFVATKINTMSVLEYIKLNQQDNEEFKQQNNKNNKLNCIILIIFILFLIIYILHL